jgi:hypothetical protein
MRAPRARGAHMAPRVVLSVLLALLGAAKGQTVNFTLLVGLQPAPFPKAQFSPTVMGVNLGAGAQTQRAGGAGRDARRLRKGACACVPPARLRAMLLGARGGARGAQRACAGLGPPAAAVVRSATRTP